MNLCISFGIVFLDLPVIHITAGTVLYILERRGTVVLTTVLSNVFFGPLRPNYLTVEPTITVREYILCFL